MSHQQGPKQTRERDAARDLLLLSPQLPAAGCCTSACGLSLVTRAHPVLYEGVCPAGMTLLSSPVCQSHALWDFSGITNKTNYLLFNLCLRVSFEGNAN